MFLLVGYVVLDKLILALSIRVLSTHNMLTNLTKLSILTKLTVERLCSISLAQKIGWFIGTKVLIIICTVQAAFSRHIPAFIPFGCKRVLCHLPSYGAAGRYWLQPVNVSFAMLCQSSQSISAAEIRRSAFWARKVNSLYSVAVKFTARRQRMTVFCEKSTNRLPDRNEPGELLSINSQTPGKTLCEWLILRD